MHKERFSTLKKALSMKSAGKPSALSQMVAKKTKKKAS